ncbi:hypothetical protein LVB77_07655 [Lysobacter sp. 5GHs7-4]|uniref:hypothetical protein n=1 Tax=Lysobacter sp. 5GHs7-4 TaxID=2904253 RepID=UPI001E506AD8|nr:hypothetical protein [Lysobacter sp. 5GHs7-4]UHQ24549.1 hypothetical protein LVB77_07655 [Lysobacter sp. 5GHs7-4]
MPDPLEPTAAATVRAPACPRCAGTADLRPKLLLIAAFDDAHFAHAPETRSACDCRGQLSVDGLKPDAIAQAPLQQFVSGLYCQACGIGFVPDDMAKPLPQLWKLSAQGFHPILADGSLGPAQARMDSE